MTLSRYRSPLALDKVNRSHLRLLSSMLFIVAAGWLLSALCIYFLQARLIFQPSKELVLTPASMALPYEPISLKTRDAVTLAGWWIPHEHARASLLFLHGNAGNMSHRLQSIGLFHQLGLSVLIIDYRGYGLSEGRPSEQGVYLDAEAAWQYLKNEQGLCDDQIIIFGRSLGGAVASQLATHHAAAALILESTFTSIRDMGRHYYPYLPTGLMARIRFESIRHIENIHTPILFIHSPDDDIVPYAMGKRLFERANQPKQWLTISGDHNTGFIGSGHQYRDGLDNFITGILMP